MFVYADYKPFTWEPPLDPPPEKCFCPECESICQFDRFGQIKCYSCEEKEMEFYYDL